MALFRRETTKKRKRGTDGTCGRLGGPQQFVFRAPPLGRGLRRREALVGEQSDPEHQGGAQGEALEQAAPLLPGLRRALLLPHALHRLRRAFQPLPALALAQLPVLAAHDTRRQSAAEATVVVGAREPPANAT